MKLKDKKGENNRIGALGEKYAARYLRLRGYRILGRDVSMRRGEIDIIARRGCSIVFVEVKTRTTRPGEGSFGRPADAVNKAKREHLVAAMDEYLLKNPTDLEPRIDVIEVYFDPDGKRKHEIIHIKYAFGRND